MLYSLFISFLLINPFGVKVSFTIANDTPEIVWLQVDNMPSLNLPPNSTSEMRVQEKQQIFYVTDPKSGERRVLFEVDQSLEGKQIRLKKLIRQVTK